MDKPLDELRDDIHKTLSQIDEQLRELSDYLTRLRDQTITELNLLRNPMPLSNSIARSIVDDPRRPYLAGRQPRRDGDTFGISVQAQATEGDLHGTKAAFDRQRQRRAAKEET